MNKEITLASLAMLKVNIDHGRDYLEYLRPYVMYSLSNNTTKKTNDRDMAKKIEEEFGLIIPQRTIKFVLKRISRSGYLKRKDGDYTIVKEIPKNNIQQEKVNFLRKISAVTHALIIFAKDNAGKELNEDDALDALIAFISKFSISCLKLFLRGTTLPRHNNLDNWKIIIVSMFVKELEKSEPERFEDFILIVEGNMLANALLCPDLPSVSTAYKRVTFYFDTPLLLDYLGLHGDFEKEAMEELISLITKLHGTITYFDHTLDELTNIIENMARTVDSVMGYNSKNFRIKKYNKSKSDLQLLLENLENIMKQDGIRIESTPPYTAEFQMDEIKFEDILSKKIYYNNPRAKQRDIKSVRNIYVLRSGHSPRSIENSKAIFVTSNDSFARAAFEYGRFVKESREVSTVITDVTLANAAWLKAPLGAQSLPRKEVMAFAYATLCPNDDFFQKVLDESDKLKTQGKITKTDHQLLRSSIHLQEELMTTTLGENQTLNESSLTNALEKIKSEIKREEILLLGHERKDHEETKRKYEEQINKYTREKERNDKIQETIFWQSERFASLITFGLCFLVALVFVCGLLISSFTFSIFPPFISWSVIGLSVIISLCEFLFDLTIKKFTIKKLYKDLRSYLSNKLYHRKCHQIGLDLKES